MVRDNVCQTGWCMTTYVRRANCVYVSYDLSVISVINTYVQIYIKLYSYISRGRKLQIYDYQMLKLTHFVTDNVCFIQYLIEWRFKVVGFLFFCSSYEYCYWWYYNVELLRSLGIFCLDGGSWFVLFWSFSLCNICYERFGRWSLWNNRGLFNLMPRMTMWWFLLRACNMAAPPPPPPPPPPPLNLLGEIGWFSCLVYWFCCLI
jgi:hypothetical protein